jgi:hypothetical protein
MDTAPLANDANETQLPDEGESVDNDVVYDPYPVHPATSRVIDDVI